MVDTPIKILIPGSHPPTNYFSAGDWLYWECKYEKARDHFENILKRPSLSTSDTARCYKSLGAVEVELKNHEKALENYRNQFDLLNKSDDSNKNQDIMTCLISMGKVYWLKEDYEKAVEYHERALHSVTLSTKDISTIHKNLGSIYTSMEQFDLALKNFQEALGIDGKNLGKDHPQIGQTYANMGMMYQSKADYSEALNCLKKAHEIFLKTFLPTHFFVEKLVQTIDKIQSMIIPAGIVPSNESDILALNNVMIVWLDEHIGGDENCRDLKNKFRRITNSFKAVESVESCRHCLPHIKNRKVFFIIQGKHAKEIVPYITKTMLSDMEPVVYIFCLHMQYLIEWAQEQECIMRGGIYDHEQDLLGRISKDVQEYIEQQPKMPDKLAETALVKSFLKQVKQLLKSCFEARKHIKPPYHLSTMA
ncbi:unnamed protein product [Adineta ricciae]|uniref:Uncharacterized protein n=1 Tax=Adineta ricciae TaxID=249248 RepID=A0A815B512_ADIRI|nr:unnamed protein product [Adineta ricciae]CAF1437104.1 unnamed protein product [Adineta ricciae]